MEDEHKRIRRRRAIKVMMTEALMFFSVILLVIFLTLIVLGYNFNINKIGTEEAIERAGLLQISSIPSGATVSLDGEEGDLFSRTSFSKTLSVGEHTVTLKRDGYDSWTGRVKISEGLLYRVVYPRLFLKEREKEEVLKFSTEELAEIKGLEFSKDGKYLTLENEEGVKRAELGAGKLIFKEVKVTELEMEEKTKVEEAAKTEKKIKEIKTKLGLEEGDKVELGEYLGEEYIIIYGGLKPIRLEEVFIEEAFETGEKKEETEELTGGYIKVYKVSELESEVIKAALKESFNFKIESVEFRGKGQLIVINGEEEGEKREVIYDFETGKIRESELEEGEKWLDEYLKYRISVGKLEIKDYDGENRRTLAEAEGISDNYGVKISANNKYLYYFIKEETGAKLVREKIL